MFAVMLGFTFFSASMWTGANLGSGLTLTNFWIAVLAGNLILGVYTAILAWMAGSTGLSIHLLSRYAFGRFGSGLPSALLAITQIGWFGVGAAMFAIPAAQVLAPDSTLLPYLLVLAVGVAFLLQNGTLQKKSFNEPAPAEPGYDMAMAPNGAENRDLWNGSTGEAPETGGPGTDGLMMAPPPNPSTAGGDGSERGVTVTPRIKKTRHPGSLTSGSLKISRARSLLRRESCPPPT